jgi:hypothetical protein
MFKNIAVTILLLALCYFGYRVFYIDFESIKARDFITIGILGSYIVTFPKLWKEAKVADKDESRKKDSV